ncbi:MAG: Ada metal-binding domain-containing protein [Patescibacteria group bacterium]|nr:Ada metal-binding domain-containing protein [Patescibacteria group bacterium]
MARHQHGKKFRILKKGGPVISDQPGRYAGCVTTKVFGRLTCRVGMRMKPENRVFFHAWADAVACGYRPCRSCRPVKLTSR